MPDIVPPGNTPLLTETDPANQIAAIGRETYDALWPRTILTYANAADRDSDLAGLAPSDTAFAYIKDKGWVTKWTGTAWLPIHSVSGFAPVTFTSGVGTITHNLGFVPSILTVGARLSSSPVLVQWALGAGTTTSTQAQLYAWSVGTGALFSGSLSIVTFIAHP